MPSRYKFSLPGFFLSTHEHWFSASQKTQPRTKKNPLTRIIYWSPFTRGGRLDPGTSIEILSFVLAFGLFSVAMILAMAFHLLCFEERKPTVKAVLKRHSRLKNIANYTLVWHSRYWCLPLQSDFKADGYSYAAQELMLVKRTTGPPL